MQPCQFPRHLTQSRYMMTFCDVAADLGRENNIGKIKQVKTKSKTAFVDYTYVHSMHSVMTKKRGNQIGDDILFDVQ